MRPIRKEIFGKTKDGQTVYQYTLTNDIGMSVSVLNYGCRIRTLYVPDRNGISTNVVMGFLDMDKYEGEGCYGALVGRFANQIKNAKFSLCGKEYRLTRNNPPHYIHGSFEHTVFEAEGNDDSVIFKYCSPSGEFGFPGNLNIVVKYHLTEDGKLELEYEATTDEATVINLTNHSYFNLNGIRENETISDAKKIYNHVLRIPADTYLENDEDGVVTGKVLTVEQDYHDHRVEKLIEKERYDHNYCYGEFVEMKEMAELKCEDTGIAMGCYSTQPGLQVFTGRGNAVALETQHYPDSPNHLEWPSTVLYPGELYQERTVYEFRNI